MIRKNILALGFTALLAPFNIALLSFFIIDHSSIWVPFIFFFLLPWTIILPFVRGYNVQKEFRVPVTFIICLSFIAGTILMDGYSRIFGIIYTLNAAIAAITTMKKKISLHAFGIAGPACFLLFFNPLASMILFLLLPVVWWARYKLSAHSLNELMWGTLYGSLTFIWLMIYVMLF